MASGITFSGFNNIDFTSVLNAIMTQESRPLTTLQARQKELQATDSAYAELATKLSSLEAAADDLSSLSSLAAYTASTSDAAALRVTASSSAVSGQYDIIVDALAKAQITASTSTTADTGTTIVADGGTLTIGGVAVALSGPVTLTQLASAINASSDAPASASIVQTSPGQYRLVLTSKETGAANAFAIQNGLTSSTIAFAGNTVEASDASLSINGLAVTSTTNTIVDGVPGVTIELLQQDPDKTVVVSVARDDEELQERIESFVSAYNDLVKFANDQSTAAGKGTTGTLGRDSLLRGLRNQLRTVLTDAHGAGTLTRLSEVGIGFSRTGELTFDKTRFAEAVSTDRAGVENLFANATTGAFGAVDDLIDEYARSGGFVADARTRLGDELSRLTARMDDMQARLAVRRASLQQEFIAADQAMSRLNSQKSALSSFGASLGGSDA